MGGCRCTYRNCTVKSDKQTHMFHYPVFDKVRCHQWLINAQRLEFLDLKISQLKNRVVCQHHFKDDQFMNFKKDKLIFDAIPTEDGPYCDSMDCADNALKEATDILPLCFIENDLLSMNEKRANFSVKYGDFLNGELVLPNSYVTTNTPINYKLKKFDTNSMPIVLKLNNNQSMEEQIDVTDINNSNPNICFYTHKVSLPSESNKKHPTQPMLVVPPFSNQNDAVGTTTLDNVFSELNVDKNRNNKIEETIVTLHQDVPVQNIQVLDVNKNSNTCYYSEGVASKLLIAPNNQSVKKNNKKIKVISEKKISSPFALKANLEPVTSSFIKCPQNQNILSELQSKEHQKSKEEKSNLEAEIELVNISENIPNIITEQVMPVKLESQRQTHTLSLSSMKTPNSEHNKCLQTSPKVSVLKSKIPPERVAEIEKKRNFNKKLRDMIVFCVEELDDPEKNVDDKCKEQQTVNVKKVCKRINVNEDEAIKEDVRTTRSQNKRKINQKTDKDDTINDQDNSNSQKVANFLSTNEPELPSLNEYNMAFFETRLKRMEDVLLRKIDQNSQRISDLKHSITPISEKKSIPTQTTENEEARKKQLFQEISQFLSPDVNSLIYEELFINRYTPNMLKNSVPSKSPPISRSPKRRKRR